MVLNSSEEDAAAATHARLFLAVAARWAPRHRPLAAGVVVFAVLLVLLIGVAALRRRFLDGGSGVLLNARQPFTRPPTLPPIPISPTDAVKRAAARTARTGSESALPTAAVSPRRRRRRRRRAAVQPAADNRDISFLPRSDLSTTRDR